MVTTSEIAAILTIWALTATGLFFVIRAFWRRRKERRTWGSSSKHRV